MRRYKKSTGWWHALSIEQLLQLTATNRIELNVLRKKMQSGNVDAGTRRRIAQLEDYNERNWKRIEELEKKEDSRARRNERDEAIKAAAAAYNQQSRKRAQAVKSKLGNYGICPYCLGLLGNDAVADHIIPISYGGLSVKSNMVLVCKNCNQKKGSLTLREFCSKYNLNRDRIEDTLLKLGKKI